MGLTRESILQLAPDASSSKAAQGLLNPSLWSNLGASDVAVWGECQGSGSRPYQTQVHLGGPSFKCSCPSRKFPCKHGLALLLMQAERPAAFAHAAPPAWVAQWLNARDEKERKRTQTAQAKVADPPSAEDAAKAAARSAKRQAQRWTSVEQGAADLRRFVGDVFKRGLGTLDAGRLDDWRTMAARLVDAQAPGLGARVTQAAALVGGRDDWPERLLHRIGLLMLAVRAIERRASLGEGALADLRAAVGWPLEKAEVVAHGDVVDDEWLVLGAAVEERDNNLFERRAWLAGLRTGRRALLLDHAFGGAGFEHGWIVGRIATAPLAFYPSAAPLRALATTPPTTHDAAAPAPSTIDEAWRGIAAHYAACPWTPWVPALVPGAALTWIDGALRAAFDTGHVDVRASSDDTWTLLAVSGGVPLTLACEWDGDVLQPLAAWDAARGRLAWQRSLPA